MGTPAGCVVRRTVKRRPREHAVDPIFFNVIRGRRLVPDDEPREPREPREQPLRIDVRPVHPDLPPSLPISTGPSKPRRVYSPNSVELVRYGYTLGCVGSETAMTQSPSRDHTEQGRAQIIKVMSSDVALIVRGRDAHERMSRQPSDANRS